MNKITLGACLAAAFGHGACADAQTVAAPAAPAAHGLGAVLAKMPDLSITGYVASTYTHFDTTPALRAFDTSQNGFRLNQAALTAAYLPSSGVGAQVTAIAGSDAKILRQGETSPFNSTSGQFDLANAFVQYATGPVTMMAGKFSTLAGAEVTNPALDANISRSLLYSDMEPTTHTGLRVVYAVNPALILTAGVNNGWNFTSSPAGTSKTLELGASGAPSKMFSYSAAFYSGQSPLFGGSANGTLQLLDLVGTINATDALSFEGNLDILSKDDYLGPGMGTGKGKANGVALYANYKLAEQWMLSARGEYIDDKDGLITAIAGNKLKELTLTVNYMPVKSLKLAAEIRQDRSNHPYFLKNGVAVNNQTSLELQAVYSF
ncbi:MAG: outer membrane beta-barrel protein [Proteobacteria bacterium]|nr:outer membrane beta-barrel protein [Pseudomonadota bacterium]